MKFFDRIVFELENLFLQIIWQNYKSNGQIYDENGIINSKSLVLKRNIKEFRQTIKNFYDEYFELLSFETKEKLSANRSIYEIVDFLYDNYLYVQNLKEKIKIENQLICNEFSKEIADLLMDMDDLLTCNDPPLIVDEDGNLIICFKRSFAFEYGIILKDASIFPAMQAYEIIILEYSKEKDYYFLEIATKGDIITIKFKTIEYYQKINDYSQVGTYLSLTNENCQWITISNLLEELGALADNFGEGILSDKEKCLLPLCNFSPLCTFAEFKKESLIVFEDYAKENDAEFLLPLLEQLKHVDISEDRYRYSNKQLKKVSSQICRELLDKRCTKLFRALYDDLVKAAASHPKNQNPNEEKAVKIRKNITEVLHKQGFIGEYPYFKKMDELQGIKLLENQMNTYIVSNEKNMVSFIKVEEPQFHNQEIRFLCGTIFLKKGELDLFEELDVYDAFFLDKGRRFSQTVYHECEELSEEIVQITAPVAAKISTMQKLSIEEKKLISFVDNTSIFALMIVFTLVGTIFFGLGMTIGFMLIELIIGLIFIWKEPNIWALFLDTPWHLIFLGSGLPCGIIMGGITVFARKK